MSESEAAAVLALVSAATEQDGVGPLSEHVMLHLRYGGDPRARNLLLYSKRELAGYAHLDPTDPVAGPSGELVIHPAHRRRGLGHELTSALVAEAGDQPLRLWAHGDLPAATRLAAAAGFDRVRALWQMRRSLQTRIGRPQVADGITIRTFDVGRDEDQWVEVNSKAFSRHPEQGEWTRTDLDLREREPWFDPDGFFLAERGRKIVGFHWTKIHGRAEEAPERPVEGLAADHDERRVHHGEGQAADRGAGQAVDRGAGPSGHGHEPIGEVYVVGVDPAERGTGLGRALTVIGLRYLRSRGLFQVMLYVDEDNTAAIGLYESLGFTHWGTDVMFSTQVVSAAHSAV
jgi:mycothiol synthase